MEIYDQYERRFAQTRAEKSFGFPTTDEERQKITEKVKRMLAFDEKLLPVISDMEEISRDECDCYSVSQLRFTTWENFHSVGTLFMPKAAKNGKVPLIFVFCGHGEDGRLTDSYLLMAERLARMGIAVMLPDNIGQGDRSLYGHKDAVAPFYCGLTLQGMILMESVALIRYMIDKHFVDKSRVGACGNSGGGTLCTFLAALAPELTALCATGYPSDFSYIHSKERTHCACNLLPGCAYGPDMWEILSLFAPKPLMIEQGFSDGLIPFDIFMRTVRKVEQTYRMVGADENFRGSSTNTTHSWTEDDRSLIADFFCEIFNLNISFKTDNRSVLTLSEHWKIDLPAAGLTTDELAQKLTGKTMPQNIKFSDIFKPTFDGRTIGREEIIPDIGRGYVMRVLAQMECALTKSEEEN